MSGNVPRELRIDGQAAVRYRKKAERLRTIASNLPGEARTALLRVADGYDKMASKAACASSPEAVRSAVRKDTM